LNRLFLVAVSLGLMICCAGCGSSGPTRVKFKGTGKYSDGTIPQGEVAVIRFEPTAVANGVVDPNSKTASGNIQPDGSFQLTTVDPNDGALPGEYKVTFTIKKTYGGNDLLVASKFVQASTTPHSASVKRGESKSFDFVIERP
jgi:hypothetical protein